MSRRPAIVRRTAPAPAADPSLRGLLAECERFEEWAGRRWWAGGLPRVVFACHPNPPRGKRLGHYCPGIWQVGRQRTAEIVLYSDLCLATGLRQVLVTVAHELCHHWQHLHGRPAVDTTWHNDEWHDEARRIGLVTGAGALPAGASEAADRKARRIGLTKIGSRFAAALQAFGPREDLVSVRRAAHRSGSKNKRWGCACGYAVWIARADPQLSCNVCGEDLRLAHPDDADEE